MRRYRDLASFLIPLGLLAMLAGTARADDEDRAVRPAQVPGSTPLPPLPPASTPAPAGSSTGPQVRPATPPGTTAPAGPGTQPLAAATPAPAPAPAATPSPASALQQADLETTFVPPIFIGDQAPLGYRAVNAGPQAPPTPNPRIPPSPPVPGGQGNRSSTVLPWIRGFKIAENQSPRPQDRFFVTFNYYDDLNYAANAHLGSPLRDLQVYRELFGFEKTFFDGKASLGLRVPLDSLTATSAIRGVGGSSTSVGNLSLFSKVIVWEDPKTGSLVSSGLAVTTPNGPTSFAGFRRNSIGFHDAQLQPFAGYIWNKGRFYLQGFEAIDVPTDPHDVTELYTDIGIGYFAYLNQNPNAWLRGIVPTFETHINNPLNHRGVYRFNDPAGTADVVDLTFGANFLLGKSSTLTFAYVNPVTGPRPFRGEFAALLNVYLGKGARRGGQPIPPVIGQ